MPNERRSVIPTVKPPSETPISPSIPGFSCAPPLSYYCPECGVGVTTSRKGYSYWTWEFSQRFWHLSCKAKVAPGGVR